MKPIEIASWSSYVNVESGTSVHITDSLLKRIVNVLDFIGDNLGNCYIICWPSVIFAGLFVVIG